MYDCDMGPVVCTKKYGKKLDGYSASSQSIAPGCEALNLTCMMMDQMYTPTFVTTTVSRPSWARRLWLMDFMSRMKPRTKQPILQGVSKPAPTGARYVKRTSAHMQKKGEIRDDRARARTAKYVPRYVDQVPLHESVFGSIGHH